MLLLLLQLAPVILIHDTSALVVEDVVAVSLPQRAPTATATLSHSLSRVDFVASGFVPCGVVASGSGIGL